MTMAGSTEFLKLIADNDCRVLFEKADIDRLLPHAEHFMRPLNEGTVRWPGKWSRFKSTP